LTAQRLQRREAIEEDADAPGRALARTGIGQAQIEPLNHVLPGQQLIWRIVDARHIELGTQRLSRVPGRAVMDAEEILEHFLRGNGRGGLESA
jgi:hypothetical protein